MKTLIERIENAARAYPQRVALRSGGRSITYQDLMDRSAALAVRLRRELGGDGSPVLVSGHKEPQLLVAYLAALRTGHPYIPLDTDLPPHRLQQVRDMSGSRLFLTADDVQVVQRDSSPPPPTPAGGGADTPAYVIFTSGTSGEPKGVLITQGGLTALLDAMRELHAFTDGCEVVLNTSIFSFDLSVLDMYLSLLCGGTLYCLTREDITTPRLLFERLAECGATVWHSTPTFVRICLAEAAFGRRMLPHLKRFGLGGETVPPDIVRQIWQRFGDIETWNLYGPTEATVFSSALRLQPQHLAYATLPIGLPLPGMQLLLDGSQERGEILISGPQLSPGYLNRPDLTAQKFLVFNGQAVYRTGDWGHVQDGLFFFDGRRDRQIKLRGHRIELEDVEVNLRSLQDISDAAVVYRSTTSDLTAFVTVAEARPSPHTFEDSQKWRDQLAGLVPRYMVPKRILVVDEFPMNANGKVDYAALQQLASQPASRLST